jgi:plasmid stabilization system protein ParE
VKAFHPRLRPELLNDLAEAFAWYEERAQGIGQALVRAFFAAVALATRQPMLYRNVHGEFRRVLLRRYPYWLYYTVEGDDVVFFLLYPARRDPARIEGILSRRQNEGGQIQVS